ncbi:nitrate- and nitrite sensing domain-containing protein [Streptomyces sp. NBC_00566]|uniref:nitrate- and nitrite sensing domain-containing protein n=1 Tax=Streptomyces sp. NBC_00566 TaxID=2975778 RepID=UPI002E80D90D|nr:nitrate- and nitrite sensing domain-containing protein [Streptomyces sp. NBC_00566]WUB89799.1 nitrate- and nitrite sensing domain-containing protein [Streptomyces sp. NBC_00566]
MRFRGKSIRRKIVALLLVPLVSLTVVWGFATVLTGSEVAQLLRVSRAVKDIGHPTEDTVRDLQRERRQSLVYLADPRAADALATLHRSRTATDHALATLRANARNRETRDAIRGEDGERLTTALDALDGLEALRRSVEARTVSRAEALDLYNRLVDPCYALVAAVDGVDDVEMDKQAAALVNTGRARELLSREDALLGSALVVGSLSRAEAREISDLVAQRTLLYDVSLPLLPAPERDRYERYWHNAATAPLRTAERDVIATGAGIPRGVTTASWHAVAGGVLEDLGTMEDQAGSRFRDRVRPVAYGVIAQAAVAGVLGLAALLVSLVLSVRVGRRLIRDLKRLRTEAHEASAVRLPHVMRRLSAGEPVDVESEVPRPEYDQNEIGEVGRALNTLQRAAVEAAVKQSELRAGVSEVFVNLARRSQVLLHKQLTLLDTMERRTEDTDELADLFRLDHLTTRMRRHAEGLVILSGAAPSRQWRRPVRLMDVVRASVAEVEDYERVEVRRLPRVAVIGPAVSDLTHLVAELLENATLFSPPHTNVHVVGERVANGFALEIHDRGLGMTAEALLDANLRLAETPEFELSDTDRLGLFVVSRLAQRQHVRVSLQPSPYGGTTAVVLIPDALLTDDAPDTNGIGIRLGDLSKETERTRQRGTARPQPVARVVDEPAELGASVDRRALDTSAETFPGALADEDSELGGIFRARSLAPADALDPADGSGPLFPLPRPEPPKLVSSHGEPVTSRAEPFGAEPDGPPPLPTRRRGDSGRRPTPRTARTATAEQPETPSAGADAMPPELPRRSRPDPSAPDPISSAASHGAAPAGPAPRNTPPAAADGTAPLPRRVRQANLAPQLRREPERRTENTSEPAARDADEVRTRMASLQRGWERGREENAEGDRAHSGTAQGTTEGDGR